MRRLRRTAVRLVFQLLQRVVPVLVLSVGFQRVARKLFEWWRRVEPLERPPGAPLVLVFDGTAVCRVLADHKRFDVTEYERKMHTTFGDFLLGLDFDAKNYQEQIRLLRAAMAPEDRERMREVARAAAQAAITDAVGNGNGSGSRIDVVTTTERTLSRFVDEYFGIPPVPAGRPNLTALNQATASYVFSPDVLSGHLKGPAKRAGEEIRTHLMSVIARARNGGGPSKQDTIADRLVQTGASDQLVCTILGGTISGLFVPTTSQFLAVVDRLLDLPSREIDAIHALAKQHVTKPRAAPELDDERLMHYVLEAARFTPFPFGLVRHVSKGQELELGRGGSKAVPADATVVAVTQSAVYDSRLVPDAGAFLIGRPETEQLVFGTGHHHCVGGSRQRPVAQILMTEMAAVLFAVPGLARAPGARGTIRSRDGWPASFELVHA